jgi:AcrR family transcriptional regulator
MTSTPPPSPASSLRERKKAKTRAAIQQHALRLFLDQGYAATTVDQIAEVAEVAPSTVFRYFATKEDLVLQDEFDPAVIESFRRQPAEFSPIRSLRNAIRESWSRLPAYQIELARQRHLLIASVPELRAAMFNEYVRNVELVAQVVAERLGRDPRDFEIRTLSGALIGVVISATLSAAEDPDSDPIELVDAAMAHLDAGLPLGD